MSLSTGVKKDQEKKSKKKINPISDLLLKKQLSEALSLINSNPEFLNQRSTRDRLPIHIAASQKQTPAFKAMLEKGASPFELDGDGYGAYYHSSIQVCSSITDLCLDFFQDQSWIVPGTRDKPSFEDILLRAGFHPYLIAPIKMKPSDDEDDPKIRHENNLNEMHFFLQVLFQNGKVPAYRSKDKALKAKEFEKEKEHQLIEPSYLQKIAAGFVDSKISPAEIVEILTRIYPNLAHNQKLACVYLLKEFIACDIDREWVQTPVFREKMRAFIASMDNAKLAEVAVKIELDKYYATVLPLDHLVSAQALTFDLTKAFHHLFSNLSPMNFRGEMLAKKNLARNPTFAAISALTDNISNFVTLEILKAKSSKERVAIIKFYLDVIKICLKQGDFKNNDKLIYNFAAAAAIFGGVDSSQVSRLKVVSDLVSKEKEYSRRYEEYRLVFTPHRNFAALRKEITEHPDCIPVCSLFSGEKDKNAEANLVNALESNGDANIRLAIHKRFLATQNHLVTMRYITDVMQAFQTMYHTDDYAWALSFDIEAPKVINLDKNPDLDQLLKQLKEMKDLNAPLVVVKNSKKLKAKQAIDELRAYLGKKFPRKVRIAEDEMDIQEPSSSTDVSSSDKSLETKVPEDDTHKRSKVMELAKEVLQNFDKILMAASVDEITQTLNKVTLEQGRERAFTAATVEKQDGEIQRKRSNTHIPISQDAEFKERKEDGRTVKQRLVFASSSSSRETRKEIHTPRGNSPRPSTLVSAEDTPREDNSKGSTVPSLTHPISSATRPAIGTYTPFADQQLKASSSSPLLTLTASPQAPIYDAKQLVIERDKKKQRHKTDLLGGTAKKK